MLFRSVGYLADAHAWRLVFFIGVGFAIASAVAWLGIEVAEPEAIGGAAPQSPRA